MIFHLVKYIGHITLCGIEHSESLGDSVCVLTFSILNQEGSGWKPRAVTIKPKPGENSADLKVSLGEITGS